MPFLLAFCSLKIGRVWLLNYLLFTAMFAANLLVERYYSDRQSKKKQSLIPQLGYEGVTSIKALAICLIQLTVLYFFRS
jgi:hypothetical protein